MAIYLYKVTQCFKQQRDCETAVHSGLLACESNDPFPEAPTAFSVREDSSKRRQQNKPVMEYITPSLVFCPHVTAWKTITDYRAGKTREFHHRRMVNCRFNKDSFISHWWLCLVSVQWGNTADPIVCTQCHHTHTTLTGKTHSHG